MRDTSAVQAAIIRAANEDGVDPAFALSVAQRESGFNPNARASKTIYGTFQMRGDLRKQYGAGNSNDPYTQAKAWNGFQDGVRGDMADVMKREPTDEETYLGHYFGAGRAARMLTRYDPSTPVSDVFTPYERRLNPEFDKAGTIGNLTNGVMGDIANRKKAFGGGNKQPSFDSSIYGEPVVPKAPESGDETIPTAGSPDITAPNNFAGIPLPPTPDFSKYGTPVAAETPAAAA